MGEWVILVRYGEISVKGWRTRVRMEKLLIRNILDAIKSVGDVVDVRVYREPGRVFVAGFDSESSALNYTSVLSRVMGIVSLSTTYMINYSDLDDLVEKAYKFFSERIKGFSFAVRTRRSGVSSFTSMDVSRKLGKLIVDRLGLRVDLENPDYIAYVEVRGGKAYLYDNVVKGPGGLPIGSEGRVLVLFSGGFDSPVATWFMMRRGCYADLVLFNIGGSDQVEVAKLVAYKLMSNWAYGYNPKLYIVDLRPLIPRILSSVSEGYVVIILRRLMMRLASRLARRIKAKALVTGESLGQVASQTLDNLVVIDRASELPVLRPLIGFDKNEIIEYARLIGVYEYSSKMREYCLIGARKTVTRASFEKALEYESRIGVGDNELENLLDHVKVYDIKNISVKDVLPTRSECERT